MQSVADHVRQFCGDPAQSWADDESGLLVGAYKNVPEQGLTTFLTAGLGSHILLQDDSQTLISQELLCTVDSAFQKLPFERLLLATAKMVVQAHKPLLRGQILGPFGRLFAEMPEIKCEAFYCGCPSFFDDEFIVFGAETNLIFVELYPITAAELELIVASGPQAFEGAIESGMINILDLGRD